VVRLARRPQDPLGDGPETLAALFQCVEVIRLAVRLPVEGVKRLPLQEAMTVRAGETGHVIQPAHGLAPGPFPHDAVAALGAVTEYVP
jgi:hypothetical protein